MNNQQIINYIKLREQWREMIQAKSNALSSFWSGLFRFGIFLAYWAVEKIFLRKEMEQMYQQNSNYKYIFYLSLAIGLWGVLDSLIGLFQYLRASQQAEQLKKQVEEIEREIV